ncbi:copper homeostasis protein CutC [Microbacterium marinilacus]|uniref:PF03932 family protein CutC n=1 Tax=Microbacterium marinilacus TaxID=415209 RepID=A0ABP7BRW7_9MICO|nr:copper homeostasis protein CutC [Microbacterium marinilacus]MBY0689129.1 copper homeostasis protein CutC [Microbacterium marinilacus]
MTAFELAVQDRAGIAVATRVRPDRMELCAALSTGGLTPSAGLVRAAAAGDVPAHVLVRPREGGFGYDPDDVGVILADVRAALAAGAAGVVVGGTVPDGEGGLRVDDGLMRRVVDAAADVSGGAAEVTFHRAFDVVADRRAALEELVALGVTRVLTSGGASRAADALPELRSLVAHAAGRIEIQAGGGVDATNAAAVVATGVDAVHASAKSVVVEQVPVALGSGVAAGRVERESTDEAVAAAVRDLVRAAGPGGVVA